MFQKEKLKIRESLLVGNSSDFAENCFNSTPWIARIVPKNGKRRLQEGIDGIDFEAWNLEGIRVNFIRHLKRHKQG